jgi:hypothetical protein
LVVLCCKPVQTLVPITLHEGLFHNLSLF